VPSRMPEGIAGARGGAQVEGYRPILKAT
jgi:hypothetical protein